MIITLALGKKSAGERKKRRHLPEKPGKCRRKRFLNAGKPGWQRCDSIGISLPNQTSKTSFFDVVAKKNWPTVKSASQYGAADRIRTCGLSGRSRTIYPAELQPHIYGKTSKGRFSFEKSLWSIRGQTTGEMPAESKITTNHRIEFCHLPAVPQLSEFCDSPQNTMYIRCFCSLCCVWQTLPGRLLLMLHRSKSWNFSKRLNSSLAVVRQWSDSRQTVVKIEGRTRRKQPKIG